MREMFLPLKVSATALEAQQVRMNVIASNIANVNSTTTLEGGGPYRRREVIFEAYLFNESSIGVNISRIIEDGSPFRKVHDPAHPNADAHGYVLFPNISTITETVNLKSATRAYEANLTLINSFKEMFMRTINILRA
ncbi:flagellar basal body rod protein FlgC [Thermodesulfovibrionales bacterium]|nr:flagellar basal body rod protein FlgC [Thermodesulfovibrionales bacterium]MCL0033616.1 flagellar basal body rod protein FlgC [Thermodesulfovibrionales bacterium]MCL0036858.1 flagellar basal body rod protein FlgC [Thermodesulfovibrionales bacterium]MCL0047094.1 flagellar basal body rod protein FlgC [Thermodesulfovibrionales bacterium]MCL0061928.1 flagellar basal body rod protein FlgC [Thermodesulfovibrionales bacterium]